MPGRPRLLCSPYRDGNDATVLHLKRTHAVRRDAGWLSTFAHVNPLRFAIDAIRDVGGGTIQVLPISMLALFAAVIVVISGYVFRKVTVWKAIR
jgi:hypothetical protein